MLVRQLVASLALLGVLLVPTSLPLLVVDGGDCPMSMVPTEATSPSMPHSPHHGSNHHQGSCCDLCLGLCEAITAPTTPAVVATAFAPIISLPRLMSTAEEVRLPAFMPDTRQLALPPPVHRSA